jgi:hypothetical protein
VPFEQIANAVQGTDVARLNLLTNGGFEIWQRGTSFPGANGYCADRWFAGIQTGTWTVSRDNAVVSSGSNYSAKMVLSGWTSSYNYLRAALPTVDTALQGKTITVAVDIYSTASNIVSLRFFTAGSATNPDSRSARNTVTNAWYRASMTMTVPSDATLVYLDIEQNGNSTVYADNATLVVGSQPADYIPMHPADEGTRCLRYYEVIGSSVNSINIQGYGAASGGVACWIPFKVLKAAAPTVTKNGTWVVINCGQPSNYSNSNEGFMLYVVATALGGILISNNATNANFVFEANP